MELTPLLSPPQGLPDLEVWRIQGMYRVCRDAKSVGVAMVFARPMHDVKIKRLEPCDPPCYNSLWLIEVTEPSQTGVVCHHREVATSQVVLKELDSCHNRQLLLVGSTIISLTRIECFRGVRDNAFDYLPTFFLLLLQDSTHADVAGICRQDKLPVPGRISQDRGLRQSLLES